MRLSRRDLLAQTPGLVLGGSAMLMVRPAFAADPAGQVAALRGQAFAEGAEPRRTLGVPSPVYLKELIITDESARLALRLGKSTTLKLGGAARLKIDRHLVDAGGELDLVAGAMLFDRGPQAPKAVTAIKSSYGLIAVRGTRVFAGPSQGVFGIFVAHGHVEVTSAGKTVSLRRGLGTDFAKPGDPPSIPKAWVPARIWEALASVG